MEDILCPDLACSDPCESGLRLDSDGCETCECLDPRIDCKTTCNMYCPAGFVKVRTSCDVTQFLCRVFIYRPFLRMFLFVFTKQDDRGCDSCTCAPQPEVRASTCADMSICKLSCRFGLARDENDCQVCECRSSPPCVDLVDCPKTCQFGLVETDDGCELCECAPDPCLVRT